MSFATKKNYINIAGDQQNARCAGKKYCRRISRNIFSYHSKRSMGRCLPNMVK